MNTALVYRGPAAWAPRFPDDFVSATGDEFDAVWDDIEGERQARELVEQQFSLTRANGWGSAGQCPAVHGAKTPAMQKRASHVVGVGQKPARTSTRATASGNVGGGVL